MPFIFSHTRVVEGEAPPITITDGRTSGGRSGGGLRKKSLGDVDGVHGVVCASDLSEHVEQKKCRSERLYGGESGVCGAWLFLRGLFFGRIVLLNVDILGRSFTLHRVVDRSFDELVR